MLLLHLELGIKMVGRATLYLLNSTNILLAISLQCCLFCLPITSCDSTCHFPLTLTKTHSVSRLQYTSQCSTLTFELYWPYVNCDHTFYTKCIWIIWSNFLSPWWQSWQSCVCSAGCGKLAGPERCRTPGWPGYGGLWVTPPEGWCPLSSRSRAQKDSAEATHSQEVGSWKSVV